MWPKTCLVYSRTVTYVEAHISYGYIDTSKAYITIAIRLRYDYDMTTTKN